MEAFYQIEEIQKQEGKMQVCVRVNAEHAIYKAHFPGHSITPGAMLVRMAAEVVASQCGIDKDVTELKNIKFLQPHCPTEQDRLTFIFDAQKQPIDVVVSQNDVVYARMSLIF